MRTRILIYLMIISSLMIIVPTCASAYTLDQIQATCLAPEGGTAATIAVNYTFTGSPGTSALVTNIGNSTAAFLDFTIPSGLTGATGPTGPAGINGTDGAPGTPGTPGADGADGTNGTNGINGTSATIVINYTFTGLPGTPANVTNIGNSTDALWDITIPAGSNYNATYDAKWGGTNYNGSYWTGTNYNSTYDAKWGGTNYNASYWTGTNYNASYPAMVGGLVPTANLGGAGADSTKYLRGDQTWQVPAGGSDPTSKSTTLLHSDFYEAALLTAVPGLTGLAISSGTAAVVATTANHPGVIYMRDSTTANGGFKYGCVGTQLIGGGETFEVVFQPVGVRSTQGAQLGWSDTAAANTLPVDGVWFNISGTGSVIRLTGATSSNSARSYTATNYTPTTATWYRGTIALNSTGGLATYTIYDEAGSSLWTDTVASNTPTGAGRDTSPCLIVAQSTTDAAADIVRLDFVKWATTRTLVR